MSEERPSVYIETSVVSYFVARPSNDVVKMAHQVITLEWWETRLPKLEPYASQFVINEAARGNPEFAGRRLEALKPIALLPTTEAVLELAESYSIQRLVPAAETMDALHLAVASVYGLDYLVTWNCRHIASASVRKRITAINLEAGFPSPIICTPEELMEI